MLWAGFSMGYMLKLAFSFWFANDSKRLRVCEKQTCTGKKKNTYA